MSSIIHEKIAQMESMWATFTYISSEEGETEKRETFEMMTLDDSGFAKDV